MEKLVAIIDEMPEYGRRLAMYLNASRTFPYRAVVFSTAEEAEGYIRNDGVYAVVAAEESEKKILEVLVGTKVKLIRLSETKNGDSFAVCRYSSAKEIERRLTEQKAAEKRIPVIGFYAPAGGWQTEEMSRTIAERLGKGGKLLYIPLFPFGSRERENGDGLSEVLYYIRQSRENGEFSLKKTVQCGENMDSMGAVRWYTDLDSITKEDLKELLQSDRWNTEYQALFVAVGQFDRTGRAVLNCCDFVLVPVWETEGGRYIQEEFRRQLKESGETKVYSGMLEFRVKETFEGFFEEAVEEAVKKGGEAIAGSSGGDTKTVVGMFGFVG